MTRRLIILAVLLLAPNPIFAQQNASNDTRTVVAQELEAIIIEADALDNKAVIVNVKARAAVLVSFSDSARSESMFLALWKFANDQTDEAFDKEEARRLILKYVFSRNPRLARRLFAEQPKSEESLSERHALDAYKESRLTSKLASDLADTDPSAAAGLLEQSLPLGVSPGGLAALSRLREKNSLLSDYVATRVVERLTAQPTLVSLPSLFMMGAYVFPGAAAPISSIEAESSLQLLQFKYFLAGYEVLSASLNETNEVLLRSQHYSQNDLQYRASYQGQLAAVLAALAPRFQPSIAIELTEIANKLAPQVPPNIAQMSRFLLSRISGNQPTADDPETNFLLALSKGDFDEANKSLDRLKNDEKKEAYVQLLIKAQAKHLLAQSDVMGALTAIRRLDDQVTRLIMYLEALKALKQKRERDMTNIVINEARLLIPQTNRNGLHVRALLSFATQLANPNTKEDAVEFLKSAVVAINALNKTSREETATKSLRDEAMDELNDPLGLVDALEMEQAFSSMGMMDLDRGLILAKTIELKPLRIVARLETLQDVIKRGSLKPPPKPAKTTRSPSTVR